ncbi:ATP-dependent nuclease [Pseudoxanthomonas kaohsiungensis]|uniref:ATP-dependent endonuclease n=1 Tax=Pseudoxanthomonas kaohsiungensis TaxID=283923 RepID=A0ABW3M1E2_9GAMM|nr:AAA family ATPase [Pseudoxanthomonas kaohsiungensis]KAF1699907.1 hypothetical protein CSC66_16865 [Pseudoxanthomonas kaohsiungensis]
MQIRHLSVRNFRGITSLEWVPSHSFCCLIGPGDSGKSTILDAIEASLSSRWFSFSEVDFIGCDTSKSICVEATVGELSKALKSDERFGLFVRGWTSAGTLRDEPEADDEPVLTVRLTVEASMEPVWELICDRTSDTRTLSNRDRALFGLIRLAGEDARHLGWGQGSVLARLTGDATEATAKLAEAYKTAKASAKLEEIKALTDAAELAEGFAKGLGAYVRGSYGPGLELGRSGLSSGSIALHDSGVPLRLAGLGTRRLATLAIQKSAITDGAIVLIDEVEHGLEPHRIIGAISQIKTDQAKAKAADKPVGHVVLTTHSDVAISEVEPSSLRVVRSWPDLGVSMVFQPDMPEPLRALLRFTPRALLAKRILVCEGNTELGLLLGLRDQWIPRHDGRPIEQAGTALADGNGNQAPSIALALAKLGFTVALFRDSDIPLAINDVAALAASAVQVIEYGGSLNTEQAVFHAASDALVQSSLTFLRSEYSDGAVNDNVAAAIGDLTPKDVAGDFGLWEMVSAMDGAALREAIARAADKKRWFKNQRVARDYGPIAWQIASASPSSRFSKALIAVEDWLYG